MVDGKFYFDELVKNISAKNRRDSFSHYDNRVIYAGLEEILDDSHIFFINGAVVESLAGITPARTNYEGIEHLPFPRLFLEFSSPREHARTETSKGVVRGLSVGKMRDAFPYGGEGIADKYENRSPGFDFYAVNIFYDNYGFDISLFSSRDFGEYRSGTAPINGFQFVDRSVVTPDPNSTLDLITLVANVVNYINAHNVTIVRTERGNDTLTREELKRDRRRKRSGTFKPRKPVNWVDVRCSTRYESDEENLGVSGQMDYREWVRGHFQTYHSNDGPRTHWKDPYVRGPNNAPWKDNRYRVLNDLFQEQMGLASV